MRKAGTSLLAALVIFSGLTTSVNAEEVQNEEKVIEFSNGQTVEVSDETNGEVSEEMLRSIAEQAANETNDQNVSITISDVNKNTNVKNTIIESNQSSTIQPMGLGYTDRITSISRTRWDVVGAAKQITTVARGATKKFTTSTRFETTFNTSVSGGIKGIQANVETGLASSFEFKSELTYTGPKSPYASRIYYVTPYYNHGNWKGYRDWWVGGKDYYSGTFVEYDHNIEWSRDIK